MLYTREELKSLCFWDIETRPSTNSFHDLPIHLQELWLEKYHCKFLEKEKINEQKKIFIKHIKSGQTDYLFPNEVPVNTRFSIEYVYQQNAPLIAEFGAVMCISMGLFIEGDNGDLEREIITFQDDNEMNILEQFNQFWNSDLCIGYKLAGYNIREFDIPFVTKRFIINGIMLPPAFRLRGLKPWEIKIVDVCDDWKGQQREIVGLDLVCTCLGIQTPKDKFKNSEVVRLYLSGEITGKDVAEYCEKDIHATMDTVERLLIN